MNLQAISNNVSAKHYQYTNNNLYLTDEQREHYEEHGFIVIRNLVDHKILDECSKRFVDICEGTVETSMMLIMKEISLRSKNVEGEYLINKIQDCAYDDVMFKFWSYKPIVDVIESIIGPQITACHTMLINKPPDANPDFSKHPLHQDLHYFPFRPANSIAAAWTAMEHIDEKNGCLFVIPGSHKGELYKHDYPSGVKNAGYHGVFGFENTPKVNLIMEKGDTVFFHPILLHGSGPNFTKGFRKAISCHYAHSNCYFIDVSNTSQSNIAKEVEQVFLRKTSMALQYNQIWKYKSRLIRGATGNFQRMDSHL